MTVQCVVSRISAREDTTVDPEGFMSGLCSSVLNMIIRMGYEAMKAKSNFPSPCGKGNHFLKEQRCPKAPQPRLSQLTTGKTFTKSLYVVGFSTAQQQPMISPEVQFCPVIHEVGHFMSQARKWADH